MNDHTIIPTRTERLLALGFTNWIQTMNHAKALFLLHCLFTVRNRWRKNTMEMKLVIKVVFFSCSQLLILWPGLHLYFLSHFTFQLFSRTDSATSLLSCQDHVVVVILKQMRCDSCETHLFRPWRDEPRSWTAVTLQMLILEITHSEQGCVGSQEYEF